MTSPDSILDPLTPRHAPDPHVARRAAAKENERSILDGFDETGLEDSTGLMCACGSFEVCLGRLGCPACQG
jgi:hypothetical protein